MSVMVKENERGRIKKYVNLRILKSVQEYPKSENDSWTAVYPIKVPDDLLYQAARLQGPESADKLIRRIFKMGLTVWSEKLYLPHFDLGHLLAPLGAHFLEAIYSLIKQ